MRPFPASACPRYHGRCLRCTLSSSPLHVVVAPLSSDGSGGAYRYGWDFASGGALYLDATFANTSVNDLEVALY